MKTHRTKHDRSLDAAMIRFVLLFGVPFVSALSVFGGIDAGLLASS